MSYAWCGHPDVPWMDPITSQETLRQRSNNTRYSPIDVDRVSEKEDWEEAEEIYGHRYRGEINRNTLSPRAPSARLRGLAAPEIRTSISPDRILRRRRKLHRMGPPPDPPDIIYIRSDSEESQHVEEQMHLHPRPVRVSVSSRPSTQSSSATLVAPPVVFIDFVDVQSSSPRPQTSSVSLSSQVSLASAKASETSSNLQSNAHPRWLRDAVMEVEEEFPRARFIISTQGMLLVDRPENWEVQCDECEGYATIPAGPGRGLTEFVGHLDTLHPHLRRNSPAGVRQASPAPMHPDAAHPELHPNPPQEPESTRAPTPCATSRRTPEVIPVAQNRDADVIEVFLAEQGLGRDVMPLLQDVGITDGARMRALGRLPDSALDRLEGWLLDRGLDFAACLLVREGLRRLAEVPG